MPILTCGKGFIFLRIYIVQRGDTLRKIAHQHHTKVDLLLRLNSHIANIQRLIPGMKIVLPNGSNGSKTKPLIIDGTANINKRPFGAVETINNRKVDYKKANNTTKQNEKVQLKKDTKQHANSRPQPNPNNKRALYLEEAFRLLNRPYSKQRIEQSQTEEKSYKRNNPTNKHHEQLSRSKGNNPSEETKTTVAKTNRFQLNETNTKPYYIPPQHYVCPCCLNESQGYRPNAFVYYSPKRER